MKIVYVLMTISCSGHTNADCTLDQQQFETLEECSAAQWIEKRDWLSGRVTRELDAAHRICLATPKATRLFE